MAGAPETLIDLGHPGPERAGARWRQLRSWWRRRGREVRAGLAGVLVLAVVAGSAAVPAASGAAIRIPVAGGGEFEVVGDLVLVAESDTRWGAYQLDTGEHRWSLRRPDRSSSGLEEVGGEVLFDHRYGFGRALDPATGQERWLAAPGRAESGSWTTFEASARAGYGVLAVHHGSNPDGLAHRFVGVDLITGRERWQVAPPEAVKVFLVGEPARVLSVSMGGQVELRAPDTGAVLAGRRLADRSGPLADLRSLQAVAVRGRLVLSGTGPDGLVLRGYAVDTLVPQWELTIPYQHRVFVPISRCGSMVCAVAAPESVVDPVAGEVMWTVEFGSRIEPVAGGFLAYDGSGVLRALRDDRTGRQVRDLSGWLPAVPSGGPVGDQVLLTRRADSGGTRVARLDPATGELSELGDLPGRAGLCRPYREAGSIAGLVCRQYDRLRVWPLPAAE